MPEPMELTGSGSGKVEGAVRANLDALAAKR
jgi:hypothetical protein